jgi:ADP-ribose pyrophosphatase YjhB (NUDIX family)
VTDPDDFREQHLRGADFLGAFAIVERDGAILFVQNERRIDGMPVKVWDLPGGQVEPGERLAEALARELREELGITPLEPEFVFWQEGEKQSHGARSYVWRSFFFRVPRFTGRLGTGSEPLPWRFVPRAEIAALLVAPYHDSFRTWLESGGTSFSSVWEDSP